MKGENMGRIVGRLSPLIVFLYIAGCAKAPSVIHDNPGLKQDAEVMVATEKGIRKSSNTWDVSKETLEKHPWLLVDREDRLRLELLRDSLAEEETFKRESSAVLERMLARAKSAHVLGTEGMPAEEATAADCTDAFNRLAEAERARLNSLTTVEDRENWIDELTSAFPPEVANGGKTWRMLATFPAVPFMYAWIANHATTEDKGPYPHEFETARAYRPPMEQDSRIATALAEASEADLLSFYAPIVVQQVATEATYSQEWDKIGVPEIVADEDGRLISNINPANPTVYSYVTHALLAGSWHTQVNYQLWYPEHAPAAKLDPEAGHTEGVLIRLTLDQMHKPLLAETVFACGCFHRVFPVEALEHEATETFGRVVSGRSALAKKNSFAIDAIIPQSMGSFDPAHPHPVVYVYAGKHFAGAVEFGGPLGFNTEQIDYMLADAAELERVPFGEGYASFFQRDGLVRGADRPEATMLFPAGFYHAGTPRIRGTHLIHFDQYDYDNPQVLEELLRLPPREFLEDIDRSPYSSRGTGVAREQSPPLENSVPRAKKKAFFCPC